MFGSGDIAIFLSFSFICLILSISTLPLSVYLFPNFKDKGFIYSKALGLLFSGYLMWLLSSMHVMKFTLTGCIICVAFVTIINYTIICIKSDKRNTFIQIIKDNYLNMILSEVIFIGIFAFMVWLFAHRIQGHETERVMDYAFMMTLSKADYMPPMDAWAANDVLNYYYFGQYIITYVTKLSGLSMNYGYTLGLFFIAAYGFVAVLRLVQSLAKSFLAGVFSAIAVIFAGNMHYFVFYKIVPAIWDILKLPGEKPSYWFANSTRYIGYAPETQDKTIHEFPAYSFIVGDLHAHVINIIIVVTILALLWAYLNNGYEKKLIKKDLDIINEAISPYFLIIGLLLAISSMSNYWDYPIYYVVSGSIILFSMIRRFKISKKSIGYTAIAGAMIYMLILLLALPFNLKFEKMVNGIGIAKNHTYIHQMIILWGFPIVTLCIFAYAVWKKKQIIDHELYVLLVGLCALGLVIIPELIYVRDIYENGYARANTMFKLTYQAFIMFGIVLGYIIYRFIKDFNKKYFKYGIVGAICLFITSMYFVTACTQWFGDFKEKSKYDGISATAKLERENSREMEAINYLVDYVEKTDDKQPVVLEADGDSYSGSCKVSALTGFPTILGWHTHEWLWHNEREYMESRKRDVKEIYTSIDASYTKGILDKYNVSYIFVGLNEASQFEDISYDTLEMQGDIIYREITQEGSVIEIIKVNK